MNVTDFKVRSFRINGVKVIWSGIYKIVSTKKPVVAFIGKFTLEWVEKLKIKYHLIGATISDGVWTLKSFDQPILQIPADYNYQPCYAFVSLYLAKTRDNFWALSKEEQRSIYTWLLVANRLRLESWIAWKIVSSTSGEQFEE